MVTESETIMDSSIILSILEERLGDFSQIMTEYDAVILPISIREEGDLLSPNTAHFRASIKAEDLRPAVAKKEPHRYLAQYSLDWISPTLLILQDGAVPIILSIFANHIYDHIKRHGADSKIKIKYIKFNKGDNQFIGTDIEGPATEVLDLINDHRRR